MGTTDPHSLRLNALSALQEIAPPDEEVIRALIDVIRDEKSNRSERLTAAEALGNIGPPAKAALPYLSDPMFEADAVIANVTRQARSKIGR